MNTKIVLVYIGAAIILGVGSFYGGMKYGQNKSPLGNFSRQNFQNLSEEQRQQFMQERGRDGTLAKRNGGEEGTNFLSGEVIAKDEEGITIKMHDGSSKIIFFSGSTEIRKFIKESIDAVEVGEQISVSGDQNPDGSYSAKTVQIEPK